MIAVRLATLDDAGVMERQTASVQQLHNEALPSIFKPASAALFPPRKLAALIQDPNCIVAVAEIGGKVVGHNRAENEFSPSEFYLYIYQIGVDKDARRQGAGTALITFISGPGSGIGPDGPASRSLGIQCARKGFLRGVRVLAHEGHDAAGAAGRLITP
jgi:hypothetical protein